MTIWHYVHKYIIAYSMIIFIYVHKYIIAYSMIIFIKVYFHLKSTKIFATLKLLNEIFILSKQMNP
jgi:hypothetical protein